MVMKPEPWGEALDELLAADGRRRWSSPTPSGEPFTQALARELADPRAAGLRLRPLRGHRPAGARRRAATRTEVREISIGDYVLNGGEVAALAITEAVVRLLPGLHGQRRVAGRGVPRGRAAGVPRLHQARRLARPRRARRCCSRATTRAIAAVAARPGRTPYRRAPPRPRPPRRCCSTTSRCGWSQPGRRRRAAHPAAGLLGAGAAGQPRRARSRRCTSRSTTCAAGSPRDTVLVARVRRAAGRRGPGRACGEGSLGHRPADGRPRPPGPRAGPAAARARSRPPRRPRPRRTRCSPAPAACATSGCTRRPATGCAARSSRAWSG